MRALTVSLLLLLECFSFVSCSRAPAKQRQLTVAAASDLVPAFEELGPLFEQRTGIKVIFSFGSTGMLTQQIANGAPMDLFAAANVAYIDELERKGLIASETKALYARGRITLWTSQSSPYQPAQLSDLTRAEIKRIAIANPEHAPYGMAARQAFETAGIWEAVKPKLVYAENIRQALQFAQTGNVDVAIVALSLSLNSDGHYELIPENLHQPLDQALAVIKGAKNEREAREFAAFINSTEGRAVMKKHGFLLPGQ